MWDKIPSKEYTHAAFRIPVFPDSKLLRACAVPLGNNRNVFVSKPEHIRMRLPRCTVAWFIAGEYIERRFKILETRRTVYPYLHLCAVPIAIRSGSVIVAIAFKWIARRVRGGLARFASVVTICQIGLLNSHSSPIVHDPVPSDVVRVRAFFLFAFAKLNVQILYTHARA